MRVNKYLASIGIASRREIDRLVTEKEIFINGKLAELGQNLIEGDLIEIFNSEIVFSNEENTEKIYIAYNKPKGIICTCSKVENNIIDAIGIKERIVPVGRLDKESRGLILLTNDGELCHKLTHPSYEHEKEYEVECRDEIENLEKLAQGIEIEIENSKKQKEKVFTQKAFVKRLNAKKFRIVLKQGYKRQIRLMVEAIANKVVDLKRIRIDQLGLSELNLAEGDFKRLEKVRI